MGIFTRKNRTLENTNEEEVPKKKGGLLDAFLGTGKYAKTEEQKKEMAESKTLQSRLGKLRIKKCNRAMSFRFNDNKNRIEVGEKFEMNQLPGIIYLLADGSTVFRRSIGGIFDLSATPTITCCN